MRWRGRRGADDAGGDPAARRTVRWRLLARRIAILAALAGLAIAQPVLGLFGDNPEFFVSGGYAADQIVWFGVAVVVVPILVSAVLAGVAELIGPRVGTTVFRIGVLGFAALAASRILLAAGVEGTEPVLLLAFLVAALVVLGEARLMPLRLFLTYLALGNVLYLGLFAFGSRTAELIARDGSDPSTGQVRVADTEAPVVLLVLDEFPLATIVRSDGTINESRYPNFARLASMSTWFRNAAARQPLTPQAVPELLSGTLAKEGAVPTAADYPRNFFSLLGGERPVYALEVATDLCAEAYCGSVTSPLSQAFEDAAVVYAHKVLPEGRLTADLPAIDAGYGGFVDRASEAEPVVEDDGASGETDAEEKADPYAVWRSRPMSERTGPGQRIAFRDVISSIDGTPAGHLVHIALPHSPWALTPYGEVRNSVVPRDDAPGEGEEVRRRIAYQMHSLQAGATDVLVGELLDHLEQQGTLDETLLVVASDHGVSFTLPDLGRKRTEANIEDLLRVPLFVKDIGQDEGVVDDQPAQTVDILPSVADLLGAETDWDFDGHSLFDGSEPEVERLVDDAVEPIFELARQRSTWVDEEGWRGLAVVGEHGELVGRELSSVQVGDPDQDRAIRFEQQADFAALPTTGNKMPFVLTGVVSAQDRPEDELVVAVNGVIAGVLDGFYEVDGGWYVYGMVTNEYREGANLVEAFSVDADGVLHPVALAG